MGSTQRIVPRDLNLVITTQNNTVGRLIVKASANLGNMQYWLTFTSVLVKVFRLVHFARGAEYLSLQGSYK